jgi:radical SAM superfamily enzyme YgiQ (UPF0313 family)
MKIALIRPSQGNRFQVTPPLSLGYLSSSLKKAGYRDIYLVDASLFLLSPSDAVRMVEQKGIPDIMGIQVYTGAQRWTKEFVALIKKSHPDIPIVVGGPHITALKELALKFIGCEYGVAGEGENAIVEFAKHIEGTISDPADVEGLIYKDGDAYRFSKKIYGFIENANIIPFPDWELLEPGRYFKYMHPATLSNRGKRPAPILTSRGCPFKCTFCASNLTNQGVMRYREPENIVAEMQMLKEKFDVDEIFITDDNLTMNQHRAEKIFDLIIEKRLNLHWRCPNGLRLDCLNEKLMDKMERSGCYYVGLGVESGNERVLKRIKKKLDLDKVRPIIKQLHKYNIMVSGFFMCGMLGEKENEIRDSIKFACSIPFDRIQVSDFVPYPGSEDFQTIFQNGDQQQYEKAIMEFQQDNTRIQESFIERCN